MTEFSEKYNQELEYQRRITRAPIKKRVVSGPVDNAEEEEPEVSSAEQSRQRDTRAKEIIVGRGKWDAIAGKYRDFRPEEMP